MLVAGQPRLLLLLLLLAEDLAAIRIIFYEEDEEGGEGEGETAGAEEEVPESRGERRPGERLGLTIVDENKSGTVSE